jgi:hypothetical protein
MKLVRRLLVLSVVVVAACGGPGQRHSSGLPSDQIAEVRGINDPWRILGMERHLTFSALEGTAFTEGLVQFVELAPGRHTLRCHYHVNVDNSTIADGQRDVELEVEAGKAYQGTLVLEGAGKCGVSFSPVSSGTPAADKAPSAQATGKETASKGSK